MAERMDKKEFVKLIAKRMKTDEVTAELWLNTIIDAIYDVFKMGKGLTLTGLGGFYLDRRQDGCAFKFNPSQKLRALFGWSSTYSGK